MAQKTSNTARIFFEYEFQGNGTYRIGYYAGRSFVKSPFSSFFGRYPLGIKIVERGNDAPRGGKNGDFVVVEFTPEFYTAHAYAIEEKKSADAHKAAIEAYKEQLKLAVKSEAATIVIDDHFRSDLLQDQNNGLIGEARSKHLAGAFKALLGRQGIDLIKSDFWQVFRIVKSKAEQA